MATHKTRSPRLGRGLSTLLAKPAVTGAQPGEADVHAAEAGAHRVQELDVNAIQPNPHQPRRAFESKSLSQLADSIKTTGLMQPIVVRPDPSPRGQVTHQLVAGERRWRAAKMAGLTRVLAIVRDLDDQQQAEHALVENLQREDLNPIERARGFQHLIDAMKLTHDQIAGRVGVDRTTITNALRLLSLDGDVQTLIASGALSAGQAKALAGIQDRALQLDLAKRAIQQDWSVRQLEREVRSRGEQGDKAGATRSSQATRSAHLDDLQRQIAQQLGTKVRIRQGRKKGTGTLEIDFFTFDQFDALLSRFGYEAQ